MLDKTATVVGLLRKEISMGPEGRNEARNGGNNVKKYIYEKKMENKTIKRQEECPIGTVLSVGTLLV